jgi:hypothetical protein
MHGIPNLLQHEDPVSFGKPAAHETLRKTIVAVVYNPADKTYLC